MANQVGNTGWSEPRAVQVRTVGNTISTDGNAHSAVSSNAVVLVDTKTEADYLMSNWRKVAEAIDERVDQLLREMQSEQEN